MAKVAIKGLVRKYGDVTAVAGIDLEVNHGEFVALLGPSGCGKTTTLRAIAGLEEVTAGEIRMDDQVVSSSSMSLPPEQRGIGMVFQSYAIWPHMTVFENVAFGLRLKKLGNKEIKERVDTVLEMVGLMGYGHRGASQLSGGQQQRVALARAIVLQPRVLLFDEPLSNLDAKLRERMRFELRQVQQRVGITSIYVTHDQQEAMVIADRVVLMKDGKVEQVGSPVAIYNQPVSRFAAEFIGLTNVLQGTVLIGTEHGVQVSLGDHGQLRCARGAFFAAGDAVEVIVRPEHIEVSATPFEGENVLKGTVLRTVFLGNLADIYVKVGPVELRGQLSPPRIWAPGDQVWVRIAPEAIVLLRPESVRAREAAV